MRKQNETGYIEVKRNIFNDSQKMLAFDYVEDAGIKINPNEDGSKDKIC
jgi:hypothetical protein